MSILIPTNKLKNICNPFGTNIWMHQGPPIFKKDIKRAIKENRLNGKFFENKPNSWKYHCSRIAYFVVNGWEDAIQIDVGVPSLRCYVDWIIIDGNHRFAAALYMKKDFILSSISGDVNFARTILN